MFLKLKMTTSVYLYTNAGTGSQLKSCCLHKMFLSCNQLNHRHNHIIVINSSTVNKYLAYDNNCKDYNNIVLENILERDYKE